MKTIVSHFYNEEYLLPWWLNHHKQIFDHGILIDYNSTDASVDIIRDICPNWEVVKTRNKHFDAIAIDEETMDIEKDLQRWRIILNTTEFLIGNFNSLVNNEDKIDFFIPALIMVDSKEQEFSYPSREKSLIEQRRFGASYKQHFSFKNARKFSNYFSPYPCGRHYSTYNTETFLILWYGFSPMNEKLLERKLQIQDKISEEEKKSGLGGHHLTNKEEQIGNLRKWQECSKDLSEEISAAMVNMW